MKTTIWRFTPLDSWFFRESRPMESVGGSELTTLFPPPARTLIGAVRTAVGNHNGVDWAAFAHDEQYEQLRAQIGLDDDLKAMRFSGPWLVRQRDEQWERLLPAPLNLVGAREAGELRQVARLRVGEPQWCDLGESVRPAIAPAGYARPASLAKYWLTAETLGKVLACESIKPKQLIPSADLFEEEPRLGIARDNRARVTQKGLLYQTRHVRPRKGVAVEAEISGLAEELLPKNGVTWLGGEGRGAVFEVSASGTAEVPMASMPDRRGVGVILVLLTAVYSPNINGDYAPLPGFVKQEQPGQTVWRGRVNDVALTLRCAVVGKALREGGWNMAAQVPRPVRSLVPAGSVFYCTPDELDIHAALGKLHLQQLDGDNTDKAAGRGLVAAGIWPENEVVDQEAL